MRDTKNGRLDARPTPYLDYAEQLLGNGFTPLPADGKAVKLKGWRHFVIPSDEDERARFIEKYECKNIGLRTGRLVAIDNDNDDPKEAARVRELVHTICGFTPFVRVGRAPREVYFFVTDTPLKKMKVGGVEILGDGQQVIVHGIHPDTQEPYRWPQESILDATPDDLPKVDKATLDRLYEALSGRSEVIDFQEKKDEIDRGNKVYKGNRNNTVYDYLIKKAWAIDTQNELTLFADNFNQKNCLPPLDAKEMAQIIHSVWKKKLSGQAWRPKQQFAEFSLSREEMETFYKDPKCLVLLAHLRMSMPPNEFCAPQKYVGEQTGWNKMTINKALKSLTEHGFIERVGVKKVSNQLRPAIVYRFV